MKPRSAPRSQRVWFVCMLCGLCGLCGSFFPAALAQAPPKQAVVETSAGVFVLDLDPSAAPNQTAHFMKLAADGAYEGTTFHRAVKYGMVQGGDPLTKDPAKRALYGTGGQNAVKAEARAAKMTRGSVAAVLVPGKPDSAGSQFFIVLADQPALDNQYTVFAHVADGIEVLQKISETPVDDKGVATERVEIRRVTIRDTPAEPFVTETAAELGGYRAVLESSAGPITIEFLVDKAPDTVRQFMRLAAAGVYNGMAFHRVAPGFVIQTGALSSRTAPLTAKQQALVHNLPPEFSDTRHAKGIVSMARGDAPDSATTSFFICVGASAALDGVYTAFGRVVDGMAAVDTIEAAPRTGEAPNTRIDLKTVRIEKRP
jgi:cyclophilin family peptidyl-prolyl cis-trans isomerase